MWPKISGGGVDGDGRGCDGIRYMRHCLGRGGEQFLQRGCRNACIAGTQTRRQVAQHTSCTAHIVHSTCAGTHHAQFAANTPRKTTMAQLLVILEVSTCGSVPCDRLCQTHPPGQEPQNACVRIATGGGGQGAEWRQGREGTLMRFAKMRTLGSCRAPPWAALTDCRCLSSLASFLCSAQTWTTCSHAVPV